MERRIISVIYDVTGKRLLSPTGESARENEYPFLYFTEKPLVRLTLVDGALGVPYLGLIGDLTFTASIDNNYDRNVDPLTRSVDDDINVPGDWDEVEDSSGFEYDKFAIRVNASTESLEVAIGTSAEAKNAKMEFKAYSGEDLLFAISFPFRVYNLMDVSVEPLVTLAGLNYFIKDGNEFQLVDLSTRQKRTLFLMNGELRLGEAEV